MVHSTAGITFHTVPAHVKGAVVVGAFPACVVNEGHVLTMDNVWSSPCWNQRKTAGMQLEGFSGGVGDVFPWFKGKLLGGKWIIVVLHGCVRCFEVFYREKRYSGGCGIALDA